MASLTAQVRDWPGGTGKTQLAVHLAQMWRKESPDGVLVWLAAASRDSALSGYRQAALARSELFPAEYAETTATRSSPGSRIPGSRGSWSSTA